MSRGAWYILAVVVLIAMFGGLAEFSVRSSTCMMCHTQEGEYAKWMAAKLKAEKKGFSHELLSCADCHMLGGPARTVGSKLRALLHALTFVVPQIDPRQPQISRVYDKTLVPSDNCRHCHLGAEIRRDVQARDLPPGLKQIGLRMDHRKHVFARDDQCSKCHERYKDKAMPDADKSVNYAEVNHLACDSCHTLASHAYRRSHVLPMSKDDYTEATTDTWKRLAHNPRWMISVPSEKTCRRCHNGQIHFKTAIFLADCREGTNYDNCIKCHPVMTQEYFEQYLKDRKKPALAKVGQDTPISPTASSASAER